MARLAGVDIPDNKRVEVALQRIYGIGPTSALKVINEAGLSENPRVKDLSEVELGRVKDIIDKNYKTEGDLRREVNGNIRRLIDIGTYRGLRHRRGLPLRGQRTKTNARSKRGSKQTVSGRRRQATRK
jgi:small subunit ribosomal protein S13